MAPLIGVMSLPVLIGLIYEKLKEMGAKWWAKNKDKLY
jgi:hypothetical protein